MICRSLCGASSRSIGSLYYVENNMSEEVADRLNRVEVTIAHLEHQVEQLNGVIVEQGKELERLEKLMQRQAATLETIELERVKATNPKPPHY